MPTYIALVNYTEEGVQTIEDSPERLAQARELAESMGGEITEWFLTLGEYDAVAISEFPDDETVAQFALAVNQMGTVRTETLKAFPEEDYQEIVTNVPG